MKIHAKTLLIFFLAVALLCVAAYLLTTHIILSQFDELERDLMLQRVERFHLDVQSRLKPVTTAVADWASSERLRRLLAEERPSPQELDVGGQTLENLGLNFVGFWDARGWFVSGRVLDGRGEEVVPMPEELAVQLEREGFAPRTIFGDAVSGRMLVGDRICFVSAAPVPPARSGDPAGGTVVGGAFLSPESIRDIELFSGYKLRILTLGDGQNPLVPRSVQARLRTGENPVIAAAGESELAAYSVQNDFQGRPLFLAELVSPRVLYVAGARSSRFFLSGLAMAGGILFFLVWYLSDRTVLSPIRALGDRVESASRAGELPHDLGIKGNDEIATLAGQIERLASSVRQAEERYRSIVEAQTEFILRYRPDGTLTFVNRAFASFLGENRSAIIGRNGIEMLPEEEQTVLRERIARLKPEAPSFQIVQRFPHHGEEYWLSRADQGEFDEEGTLAGVQSVIRDITESRRAEKELQQSEARYRTFFEAAADGIMIVDGTEERILDVNPGLVDLFGWPKEHFLGEVFWKLPTFRLLVDRVASTATVLWPGIRRLPGVELRRRNGESVFVDVITVSYLSAGRQVVQWNFRDVTAARRSEDALRQLSGRLLRLQDEERRRIARELHDSTGQNLTALQINLARLDGEAPGDGEDGRQLLHDSRILADRCSAEIRTISYLLHPPLLDEVGLAFSVKWFAEGFSKRTGVPVEVHVASDFPRLSSDAETSLFRVVQEAMSNIHRHSGSTQASVELVVTDEEVLLEIRDNGSGMPAELVEAVNNSHSSFGVGLAGMRERIAQFGGNLRVSSGSTGTQVRATIPTSEVLPCPPRSAS